MRTGLRTRRYFMLPCNGCAYRDNIPSNCHIKCRFDWSQLPNQTPRNQGSPSTAQWFMFPFNYDPTWGPDECPARSESLDQTKIAKPDPFLDLLLLLG